MKRLSFCLAILLLLTVGLVQAQTASVTLKTTAITGASLVADTLFLPGPGAGVVKFPMNYQNGFPDGVALSNAYQIYSPDGASWAHASANGGNIHGLPAAMFGIWLDSTTVAEGGVGKPEFGGLYKFNLFGADGLGKDTCMFSGAANDIAQTSFPAGHDGVFFRILLNLSPADSGKHICIDSASNYPPSGTWKWPSFNVVPSYNVFPTWGGPYCFVLAKIRNQPPSFVQCPTNLTHSHCDPFTFNFDATDVEGNTPLVFSLVSGIGSIDASTGVYTANGVAVGTHNVVVGVSDPTGSGQTTTCAFDVVATNVGPTIACPGGAPVFISVGDTKTQDVDATDDCDPLTFSIVSSTLTGATIDPVTGIVTYTGNIADTTNNGIHCAVVEVTDGLETSQCTVCWQVSPGCAYELTIEKKHNVLQGVFENVDIILSKIDAAEGLGGFDLLIAYDNSALSFQAATEGAIYTQCGWEYFTYRFGANGNCSGGCPSGLIRIVGLAETNNGANHPTCTTPKYVGTLPTTLAHLQFLVSNNRTLECQYVPIRFFWVDCGDNTLSNASGSKLFTNCKVFDYDNENPINDASFGLPGYLGSPTACITSVPGKAAVERNIDMHNGGIDIVCADSIDARGDINLNGLGYEIADAVMFTNYFIYGLSAFVGHIPGSQAASDVNADGISLSVADLVYLIRVIVGDALPYPKPTNLSASVTTDNGVTVEGVELGAVFMVLKGEVTPISTTKAANMVYAYDGTNTRVLFTVPFDITHAAQAIVGFNGQLLENAGAEIVSIEMADVHGFAVKEALPTEFALLQNYPNPFNPTCKIAFDMPKAGDYKISVYNVTGQKVTEIVGSANAGRIVRELDMTNNASGVYFYKLEADGFTATKKAVLLK
jgi:hypothetical protein